MGREFSRQLIAGMLAPRQITHRPHFQRRPLGARARLVFGWLRPLARAIAIITALATPAAPAGRAPFGTALPLRRRRAGALWFLAGRPGGFGGPPQVRRAAQSFGLGHGLEFIVQPGAQAISGRDGRFPAHALPLCASGRPPGTGACRWRPGWRARRYPVKGRRDYSSLSSSAVGTNSAARLTMPWFSRTRFSISIASSLCSFRYSRTLSLPWPMRLPL